MLQLDSQNHLRFKDKLVTFIFVGPGIFPSHSKAYAGLGQDIEIIANTAELELIAHSDTHSQFQSSVGLTIHG